MQAVLCGQDVVVASGTGSGKSLVFQGLTLSKRDAIVVVISPLISIMEEQVTTSDLRSR
jgi:superfamily II DNA helicase RecQ